MVGCADLRMISYFNSRSRAEIAPQVAGEHVKIDALAWKKEQDSVLFVVPVVITTASHVWGWG
jgi:hypothetical protein